MEMKVRSKEIERILRNSGIGRDWDEIDKTPSFVVHHMHKWDHGYCEWWGTKVYEGGIYETGDWFWGTRRSFYADFQDMLSFFSCYFQVARIDTCIAAPCWQYHQFEFGRFVPENDICEETYLLLREHGIRKGERSGILLDIRNDQASIELVLEGGFRGYTTLCLLCPERQLLLTPDHHFGVTFYTQNLHQEESVVKKILEEFPSLCFWNKETRGRLMFKRRKPQRQRDRKSVV